MATKWNDISYILRSRYRLLVLQYLAKRDTPITPTKLKKELNIDKAHISRALKDLVNIKLVDCLTPDVRKAKLFRINNEGIKVEKDSSSVKL